MWIDSLRMARLSPTLAKPSLPACWALTLDPALPLQVDNVAAAVLGMAYVLAAVLIFVLQHGYIHLFADDNLTARSSISH